MEAHTHIKTVTVGPIDNNCYILYRDDEEGCVVVDPGFESKRILEACEGRKVKAILLTHGHFDHIGAVDEVADDDTEILIHREDAALLTDSELNASALMFVRPMTCRKATRLLEDDERFTLCGMEFRCIHTPGHTRGSCCYEIGNTLLTGDTVFHDGYGRTDLPGGSMQDLMQSLRKLHPLMMNHEICPGH